MKITETLKNFKKYAKDFKRKTLAKVAMLAGLSVTLTACGTNTNSNTQQYGAKVNANNNTSMVQEIDENDVKVESVEETTNDKGETVKVSEGTTENGEKVKITETTNEKGETVKVVETTNEKGETVKVTEKTNDNGEVVKVTEKTDANGNVTEKVEEVTEVKTEIKTEPKTEQVTTTKVVSNIKTTTTQATTKPIQTTAKPVVTTTQTTAKPIVTTQAPEPVTQAPTKPIKTNFTKYDLLDQDPEVAAAAFEKLSDQLCEELFNGYLVSSEYKTTAGYEQAKILLATLNYNEGINPEVLGSEEALGEFSRDEFLEYGLCADLPQEQALYGSRVDFNKYMLDDNFANEIEDITNKYFDWINNGNNTELENSIYTYFNQYNYGNLGAIDNYIKLFYMSKLCDEYEQTSDDEIINETFKNYMLNPIYNSFEPYKGHSYTR